MWSRRPPTASMTPARGATTIGAMSEAVLMYLLLPALVGCACGVAVTWRAGDLAAGLAALLFPLGFALAAWIVWSIADPDRGCSEECWSILLYFVVWLAASVGAEVGLVGGTGAKWLRARQRRVRDPRASSP